MSRLKRLKTKKVLLYSGIAAFLLITVSVIVEWDSFLAGLQGEPMLGN